MSLEWRSRHVAVDTDQAPAAGRVILRSTRRCGARAEFFFSYLRYQWSIARLYSGKFCCILTSVTPPNRGTLTLLEIERVHTSITYLNYYNNNYFFFCHLRTVVKETGGGDRQTKILVLAGQTIKESRNSWSGIQYRLRRC